MRQTQDIVVARLRELVRRWRVDSTPGAPLAGHEDAAGATLVGDVPGLDTHVAGPDDLVHGRTGRRAVDDDLGPSLDRPASPDPLEASVGDRSHVGRVPTPWGRVGGLLAALALTLAAVTAFVAWPRPVEDGSGSTGPGDASVATASSPEAEADGWSAADPFAVPTPSTPSTIVVHVAGEVRRPGVVRLLAGSRVIDAVEAVGGVKRGGSVGGVNLARVLGDGERVEVGSAVVAEGAPPSSGAASGGGSAGGLVGPVNLNTATADQLDTLPGIGPVTAAKILAWRSEHGRFSVVDELAEVPGIGPKTLAELRPHVRV